MKPQRRLVWPLGLDPRAALASRSLGILAAIAPATMLAADTNESPDQIPSLQPPRGEIPPGFWEVYGVWVVVGGLLFVGLVATLVWYLQRPKPKIPVPADVLARKALEQLRQQPEDGVVLSRVSQIMRRYAGEVFGLPPGELTTTEFCDALAGHAVAGADLAGAIADFLRQCDERKFAPTRSAPALGAAVRALQLIDAAQARLPQSPA